MALEVTEGARFSLGQGPQRYLAPSVMSEAAEILYLLKRGNVEQKEEAVKAASLYVYDRSYFPEALPLLMELLEQEPTPKIAEEAAWALWKFKDQKAVPVLLKKAKDAKTVGVREKAIRALGLLEATEALPFLREMAFRKNREPLSLKAAAITALGFFKDNDLIPHLLKQLKNRESLIRKEALNALERFFRRDPKSLSPKEMKKILGVQTLPNKKGFDMLSKLWKKIRRRFL